MCVNTFEIFLVNLELCRYSGFQSEINRVREFRFRLPNDFRSLETNSSANMQANSEYYYRDIDEIQIS